MKTYDLYVDVNWLYEPRLVCPLTCYLLLCWPLIAFCLSEGEIKSMSIS